MEFPMLLESKHASKGVTDATLLSLLKEIFNKRLIDKTLEFSKTSDGANFGAPVALPIYGQQRRL